MSAAHTPGPWETSSNGKDWDVCERASGDMLADLRGCDNAEENARLIAAAPQLVEALRACEAALSAQMLDGSTFEELNGARDKVRAALTAAGVTP